MVGGIPIFKPRDQTVLLKLAQLAADIGCPAFAHRPGRIRQHQFCQSRKKRCIVNQPPQIGELVKATNLPFIAKGIMHPDDAQAMVDAGVSAIVVSNHGGRVMDGGPGTAEVLPMIVERVGKQLIVLADGGTP